MVSAKKAEKPKAVVAEKKAQDNTRRPISGKKVVEHARSQKGLTKKQVESMRKRALARRSVTKKAPRFVSYFY